MKAALFQGPNKDPLFRVEEIEMPRLEPNEILVKNYASAICGTDLHIIDGSLLRNAKNEWLAYKDLPIVVGHEASGIIEEVGAKVKRFKKGDRVFTAPNIFCGECVHCLKGYTNLCNKRQVIGLHYPGFHSEYFRCDENALYSLPDNIDFQEGCLIGDTLGTALHAVNKIDPSDKTIAIWGLGPIGSTIAQVLKNAGAKKIIGIDVVPERIQLVRQLGITDCVHADNANKIIMKNTDNEGVDISFEVTGVDSALESAFNTTRKGGTILVVAIHSNKFYLSTLALSYREISMLGSFSHLFGEAEQVFELISKRKIDLKKIISNVFNLENINEAYKLFMEKKTNKVVLIPNE